MYNVVTQDKKVVEQLRKQFHGAHVQPHHQEGLEGEEGFYVRLSGLTYMDPQTKKILDSLGLVNEEDMITWAMQPVVEEENERMTSCYSAPPTSVNSTDANMAREIDQQS